MDSALDRLKDYVEDMKREGLTGYAMSIEKLLPDLHDKIKPREVDRTDIELKENCESICSRLEQFAAGYLYDNEEGEMKSSDDCKDENGEIDDERYFDFYSYFILDNLGIKVTRDIQSIDDIDSCRICVAWGGPNIYIDTSTECVEGYWGFTGRASVPFSREVTTMIESEVEEFMGLW